MSEIKKTQTFYDVLISILKNADQKKESEATKKDDRENKMSINEEQKIPKASTA